MKFLIPIICLLFIFISSCQKSDDDTHVPPVVAPSDSIVYHYLDPNLILHPVISFGPHPSGLCNKIIPYPSDSVVTATLDINGDGVHDFQFTYRNFYQLVSMSGPCANYNSEVIITGLNIGSEIASRTEYDHLEVFILNDTISSNSNYSGTVRVYRDIAANPSNFGGFGGVGYVGIKLADSGYGWMKLSFDKNTFTCTVMEYALNHTSDLSIIAVEVE